MQGEETVTQNIPSTAGPAAETILRTLDEGGSLTLSAVRGSAGWTAFTVVTEERPPFDALDDDAGEGPETDEQVAGPAETWKEAVELLDRFVWHVLHPDYVHPDFRQAVIAAVRERAADKNEPCTEFVEYWLPGWELKCAMSEEV
jgi:hypothetical protein